MVTPDNTRYLQDVTPGLVRQLHETLATNPLAYRNRTDVDYNEVVKETNLVSAQSDDGYLLGIPFGRHLRLYYEFDSIEAMRKDFVGLLDELSRLAMANSDVTRVVLDFNDFPRRHHQDNIFVGASLEGPLNISLMRCRDVREQEIPDAPDGVSVRAASSADGDAITGLEERLGDGGLAPPLPKQFFEEARFVGLAEIDGKTAGYIRLVDVEKRGILADQFVIDPEFDAATVSQALLHAAFEHGREDNRRAFTLQVEQDSTGDSILRQYGLKHAGDSLRYDRPADPDVIAAALQEQVVSRVKVGKIWGRF